MSEILPSKQRCGWFGEGRGQCFRTDGHPGAHVCEEDWTRATERRQRIEKLCSDLTVRDAEIERLTAQRSEAMREITRMQGEIERLNRFADFLCRQDWTSRGRAIAEEAFMNAIAMDKEAGFPQPESRDG